MSLTRSMVWFSLKPAVIELDAILIDVEEVMKREKAVLNMSMLHSVTSMSHCHEWKVEVTAVVLGRRASVMNNHTERHGAASTVVGR